MTLYLKYRPQKVADLDLDGVRDGLAKIILSNRIPHAFLFSGPRGAGKTSTARILAKVVNCENRKVDEAEPCNKCQTCLAITRGSSLDVMEIDAASNRGVDDIRTLRETVKLASTGGKKKVYIIDEAHMLTTEAANALLKTLEEPPDHVIFILATTAPEKLPDTIRSRCTTINFYKGRTDEIIRSLNRVIEGEGLEVEDGAIEALAECVDGSFREAHKLLEQLSFEGKITISSVKKLTSVSNADPMLLITHLANKDSKEAIDEIASVFEKGVNLKLYATEVVGFLRREMLAKVKGEETESSLQLNEVQSLLELFSDAIKQLPTAVVPQLPLEIAIVKYCIDQPTAVGNKPQPVGPAPSTQAHTAVAPTQKLEKQTPAAQVDSQEDVGTENDLGTSARNASQSDAGEEVETLPERLEVIKIESQDLQKAWLDIMRGTKSKNTSVEALLRAARPLGFDGEVLKIEVFYKFHKDRLESDAYRKLVEEVASNVLGSESHIICVLSQEKKRAADITNVVPPNPQDEEIVKVAEEIFGTTGDGKIH